MLASYPGSLPVRGRKREPGTHCMRMRELAGCICNGCCTVVPIVLGKRTRQENDQSFYKQINAKGVGFSNNSPVGYSLEPE